MTCRTCKEDVLPEDDVIAEYDDDDTPPSTKCRACVQAERDAACEAYLSDPFNEAYERARANGWED